MTCTPNLAAEGPANLASHATPCAHARPRAGRRRPNGLGGFGAFASGWLVLAAVSLISATPGCGNVCTDLAEICPLCTDVDYQQSCEETVTAEVQEICDSRIGLFRATCVGEPAETSTSSSAASSVAASSVANSSSASSSSASSSSASSGAGGAGGGS